MSEDFVKCGVAVIRCFGEGYDPLLEAERCVHHSHSSSKGLHLANCSRFCDRNDGVVATQSYERSMK